MTGITASKEVTSLNDKDVLGIRDDANSDVVHNISGSIHPDVISGNDRDILPCGVSIQVSLIYIVAKDVRISIKRRLPLKRDRPSCVIHHLHIDWRIRSLCEMERIGQTLITLTS